MSVLPFLILLIVPSGSEWNVVAKKIYMQALVIVGMWTIYQTDRTY